MPLTTLSEKSRLKALIVTFVALITSAIFFAHDRRSRLTDMWVHNESSRMLAVIVILTLSLLFFAIFKFWKLGVFSNYLINPTKNNQPSVLSPTTPSQPS